VSLIARYLEENDIPTVVMGCAKDIVEHVGVPRFVYSDFPLGNSAGKPNDTASQTATLKLALDLLDSAVAPRTTVQSSQRWASSAGWKEDFYSIAKMPAEDLARKRAEFDEIKRIAKERRDEA